MLKKLVPLFLFSISLLSAQDWLEPAYGVWGVGATVRDHNYHGTKADITPGLFVFGGYDLFFIEANRAGYTIYRDGVYFASVVAQIRTHQYRVKANGLSERKKAIEAGFHIGRRLGNKFNARFAILQDISKTHKSWEAELLIYRAEHFGNLRLLTAIGLQLQSSGLVNYYYGTSTYHPDKALGAELEMIATYRLQKWAVFSGLRMYWYNKSVSSSSIAAAANITQFFSGFGYYF